MGCKSCDTQKPKYRKGLWSPEEDHRLRTYVLKHGHGCWSAVPGKAGLQRNGKSCRLRWINYLRPGLKHGVFTVQEEETILTLHGLLGNKWSQIATHLPGRTDNEIKNHWNSYLRKKTIKLGFESETPITTTTTTTTTTNNNNNNNNNQFLDPTSTMKCQQPKKANGQFSKFEYLEPLEEIDQTSPTSSNSALHLFSPCHGAENQKSSLPKLLFTEWLAYGGDDAGRNFMDSGESTFLNVSLNSSSPQEMLKQELFNVEGATGSAFYEFGGGHGEFRPQFEPENEFPTTGFYDLLSPSDFCINFSMNQDVIY